MTKRKRLSFNIESFPINAVLQEVVDISDNLESSENHDTEVEDIDSEEYD